MNRWIISGNLGREPEMNYTPNGKAVTKFGVAVNNFSDGNKTTTWVNVVCWEKLAENCNAYLHKGSKVLVEGAYTSREYTDKAGVKRNWVELLAHNVEFLNRVQSTEQSSTEETDVDDKVPF